MRNAVFLLSALLVLLAFPAIASAVSSSAVGMLAPLGESSIILERESFLLDLPAGAATGTPRVMASGTAFFSLRNPATFPASVDAFLPFVPADPADLRVTVDGIVTTGTIRGPEDPARDTIGVLPKDEDEGFVFRLLLPPGASVQVAVSFRAPLEDLGGRRELVSFLDAGAGWAGRILKADYGFALPSGVGEEWVKMSAIPIASTVATSTATSTPAGGLLVNYGFDGFEPASKLRFSFGTGTPPWPVAASVASSKSRGKEAGQAAAASPSSVRAAGLKERPEPFPVWYAAVPFAGGLIATLIFARNRRRRPSGNA